MSTSPSLLARLRAGGDDDAWQRLVRLYGPLVERWCVRAGLGSESADITQDVFQKVSTGLDRFRKEEAGDSFRAWLKTIAVNKFRDHWRASKREPHIIQGSAAARLIDEQGPFEPESDDESRNDEHFLFHAALEQIRRHFKEHTWQAFWTVVVDGRPTRDVAEELSMTEVAVRVSKSRVLQRLRKELGDLL